MVDADATRGQPLRPDYGGAWVGGVMPALVHGPVPDWVPACVGGARGVVLLVLDGLGWNLAQDQRSVLPALAGMQGGPITAAVPSTTATGLTSITTGLTPGEHGLVGYRFRAAGEVLNVLKWERAGGGEGPAPASVQPHPPFLGACVPVVTKVEFARSGFTGAHLRGVPLHGWRTPANIVTHCRRLVAAGNRVVYAYYEGVDKVAHGYGLRDEFLTQELRAADRLVADLLEVLPTEYVLLVTADHGQVHIEARDVNKLEALDHLVGAYSGEGRFRSLHARPGASAELAAGAREHFGALAWVFTREELTAGGWLGPSVSAEVAGRVGDVVMAAKGTTAFLDPGMPQEAGMRSMHGSLTPDEVLVPLLAAPGGARAGTD